MTSSLRQTILDELSVPGNRAPRDGAAWRSFDEREWERALKWMDLGGLALYFRHHLQRTNSFDAVPDNVWTGLQRRDAGNRLRAAEIVEEARTISRLFREAGVRYAVLKGIALLPDYCPAPALRTQYDHDLLVDGSSLELAEDVLRQAGYQRKSAPGESCVVYRRKAPEVRFSENFEGLYSPLLGRSIELHLALWEKAEEKIEIDLPGDFLERAVLRGWNGFEYRALTDEDCLLFQILHAFRHILRNWCRLSVFLEIGYFLTHRSSDASFWNTFAGRTDGVRWAPEASLVIFGLASRLFGAPLPAEIRQRLTTHLSPALNLWIDTYGKTSALSNFHGDKCILFLYREFVDDPSAWTSIRRRRLFPVRRPHRPPPVVFQRGFSYPGKVWMEGVHALRRLRFHVFAGLRYACEYPRWTLLRRRIWQS